MSDIWAQRCEETAGKLNAARLELAQNEMIIERLRGLVRQGQNYAIDLQGMVSGSAEYKAALDEFIEACDGAADQPSEPPSLASCRCPAQPGEDCPLTDMGCRARAVEGVSASGIVNTFYVYLDSLLEQHQRDDGKP